MLAPVLYKHSAGQTKQVCWLNLARRAARLQSLMEEAEIRSGKGRLTFSLYSERSSGSKVSDGETEAHL